MKLGRLRSSEWIAGLAGAGVVAVMFAPLYEGGVSGAHFTQTGWEALTAAPTAVSIAGALGVALFVIGATQRTGAVSIAVAGVASVLSMIALVFLLVRVLWLPELDPPAGSVGGETAREPWLYAALALGVALFAGSWRVLGDERFGRGALGDPALRAAGKARLLPTPPATGAGGKPGEQA